MLRRKVGDTRTRLPQGASVQVQDDFRTGHGMLYALTGDGVTERRLSDYAEAHPPRDRRSGGRGPRHGLRRTGGVHRHFDAPGEDGHARRLAGRGAGDAQRTERYLLYGLLRQWSRPDPGDRRRQVPDRGADRTHGHPGARRRPTAAGRHRHRGARLCDTRAQRHDLRGTAGVGHRRRGRFGNGYRQGRRRGRAAAGRTGSRTVPGRHRVPQGLLPARTGDRRADDLFW